MARKRYNEEDILRLLREIEVHLHGGMDVVMSSPQIMYHFLIEFLELVVSCSGLGEGGCDCTALAMH